MIEMAVAAGALPPLAQRLPREPRRDLPSRKGWAPGAYGGSLRILARGGRDARDLVLLGYARLMVWTPERKLLPDILQDVRIEEGRRFTLILRKGHRWSDGHPFTSADFQFWWQDVAMNAELSPRGLPAALLVAGQPPRFEVLDEVTLRYSWDAPNPEFLAALAAASPLFIYRPAHYLRRFHARYVERAELDNLATDYGLQNWAALYHRRDRMFRFDNPDLPSLQPWVNTSRPPSERFIAERNPYFHRVDAEGRQLPYIDRVLLRRADPALIPTKSMAGESDLQARGLGLQDFTLLKEAEAKGRIKVRLWPIGRGAQLALYPNFNTSRAAWRHLLRDLRFRRALSLAIDRNEINNVIYQKLAKPGANSVLPASPLYHKKHRRAWAAFDLDRANRLLDDIGLPRGEAGGTRQLPDGRPMELIVETAEVDPAETDILELIATTWEKIGVKLVVLSRGRQVARQRVRSGATVMSLFYGLADGLADADQSPAELAPTSVRQNNWPLWGLFHESGGSAGEAPDMPAARQQLALYEAWRRAETTAERQAIWQRMLTIQSDQVLSIGLLGGVGQPIVARADLRNLPDKAPYLYEPGAYFGIYRPDTFWITPKDR